MKKLCVFPNDPLKSYFKKGEIKLRYFNPKNIFDEVHVISLFDEDIEEEKVKVVAGNAFFKIHVIGKVNLLNKNSKKKEILNLIKKINPDVTRSYNPLLQGWMAAQRARSTTFRYTTTAGSQKSRRRPRSSSGTPSAGPTPASLPTPRPHGTASGTPATSAWVRCSRRRSPRSGPSPTSG